MTKLAIIIPCRNTDSELISRNLTSIFLNIEPKDFEVVFVDSSDKFDVEFFRQWPIKLIHSDKPLPCGIARNIGVQNTDAQYIWCVDSDDILQKNAIQTILESLETNKDMYFLPWVPMSQKSYGAFIPHTFEELTRINISAWNKAYKRELYVPFPDYHPEDVVPHFELLDKIKSFQAIEQVCYIYDDINPMAYSRTVDWLKTHPSNLIQLAQENTLDNNQLRDDAIPGCLKTAADLYAFVHKAKKSEVKIQALRRLRDTWRNISAGYYVH